MLPVPVPPLLNRLHLDTLPPEQKKRIKLIQGSLTYRDKRMSGFDAAAVVKVFRTLAGFAFAIRDHTRIWAVEHNHVDELRPSLRLIPRFR